MESLTSNEILRDKGLLKAYLSGFQQNCNFRHVVVTGTLSWLVLVFTNFGAFIKYLAKCKVTSQIPVTTTGRKIQITQIIAEKWTGVVCVMKFFSVKLIF